MTYYKFQTFTTSYYFPEVDTETKFLYGLYSTYGGKLSRWYWRLFKQSHLVRLLTSVSDNRLPFPYIQIRDLTGEEAILSFNMGSPGKEQKISMLGYVPQTKQKFFAKFAQKPDAMRLSRHEIEVLRLLNDSLLVPQLLDSKIANDYVYLQTECVQGRRPYDTLLNNDVVDLLITLSSFHYPDPTTQTTDLRTCLSHGDFCPWNMLGQPDNSLRMIDWEMADERILGYDLFTWLLNVAGLVIGKIPLYHIIEKNRKSIMRYFNALQINDYTPYLKAYVELQMKILHSQNKQHLLAMYQDLYKHL